MQYSGCNGGLMKRALLFVKNDNCLMSEEDYPTSGVSGTCKKDCSKSPLLKVTGYKKLDDFVDEEEKKNFLYENGPLAVLINATPLQTYTGGILDFDKCSTVVNAAVLLIGYGNENGVDYWICKNSWGVSLGEKGYFRVVRGKEMCGINKYVITGIIE